ncbi:MAG: flagellar protein FlaG [Treponema sp.]|jgi:flagellar protein FlaG|nr:flagellar protein FlaG [Treponema sp.]
MMNMPISNVMSGASTLELPGLQARSEKQRAVAERIIAALPGNDRHSNSDSREIRKVAADIVQVSQTFNKRLHFVVDHQSNEVIVKVIDKATDKVIKVLPPEELQRLHRKLKETIGFLFNEQV